jgi:multimeric flavodoxin WrbA
MKVLGVVGSPRRGGNTHTLVSRVLQGARDEGAACDLVLLGDLTIRECVGCHACWRERECCQRDDMNALYPRLAESDAVVFGTPVYWYGPTALMKAFLDRFVYFNCPENRPQVRGTGAALVVPFEESHEQTAELLVALFERSFRYLEIEQRGVLLAPGVTRKGEVREREGLMGQAYELGRGLARA